MAWDGEAWCGVAWFGMGWFGMAWPGRDWNELSLSNNLYGVINICFLEYLSINSLLVSKFILW